MKNQIKTIGASLMVIMFLGVNAVAAVPLDNKAVEKARTAVEQASPDDWKTLEASARKMMQRNENMKEAAKWIDASIAIKATPSNLELKGDYYMKYDHPEKALKFYVESSKSLKEANANNSTVHLEKKIRDITKG